MCLVKYVLSCHSTRPALSYDVRVKNNFRLRDISSRIRNEVRNTFGNARVSECNPGEPKARTPMKTGVLVVVIF